MTESVATKHVSPVDITEIEIEMDAFLTDARKTTNKAAAARARKVSMTLRKLLKAYQLNSIK